MHSGSINRETQERDGLRCLRQGWRSNHDLIRYTGCTHPATLRSSIRKQLRGERMEQRHVERGEYVYRVVKVKS